MTPLSTDELFEFIDQGTFIDRYVERFTEGLDGNEASMHEFDRMIIAERNESQSLVWGAVGNYSKHMALLMGMSTDDDPELVRTIQAHLQQLNLNPTGDAMQEFTAFLREQFASLSAVSANALIEIPDPTVPKLGEYPVASVILFTRPDGVVTKSVKVTLKNSGFSAEDPDEVLYHVDEKTPPNDIRQYADKIYSQLVEDFRAEIDSHLISDVVEDELREAGYQKLKQGSVPEGLHPVYVGAAASYWQKELWNVEGIDASTGFARIWYIPDEEVGLVQSTGGDIDVNAAIEEIRRELTDPPEVQD